MTRDERKQIGQIEVSHLLLASIMVQETYTLAIHVPDGQIEYSR